MIDIDRIRFPGRHRLRRRVLRACGPGKRFAELEHHFGNWVNDSGDTSHAALGEVEQHVAGYLEAAARAGRRWGAAVGVGVGVALVVVLVFTLAAVRAVSG